MGCDIHGFIERKVNGKWVGIKDLYDRERNYKRFAALAGVRGDGPEPKGVPGDVSESTKYWIDEWNGDGHSHSYLQLKDALDIFKRTVSEFSSSRNFYSVYEAFDLTTPDDWDEYRLVFWFDN